MSMIQSIFDNNPIVKLTMEEEQAQAEANRIERCNEIFGEAYFALDVSVQYNPLWADPETGVTCALVPWDKRLSEQMPMGVICNCVADPENIDEEDLFIFVGTDYGTVVIAARDKTGIEFIVPNALASFPAWQKMPTDVRLITLLEKTEELNNQLHAYHD